MKTPPSILIVDDEPNNFDVIEALLDDEGFELHYASSGQKALDRLETFQPDVILLDVMMPELNGIEVCQTIKSMPKWKPVPIIMITALTAKEDLARCLAAGANDFMSKPVNSIELRARVRSMLQIKQQYDSLQELLKMREDMVHMMVHDLRNPLTNIMLSAELLNSPSLPPERKQKKVDGIIHSAQRLQSLIESLLLMAKIESGKIALNYSDIDLDILCREVIQDFEPIVTQRNLEIVTQLFLQGKRVHVDALIFRRVLENLLSNAIKFSPSKSKIVLSVEYPEFGDIKIQVSDFGSGINEELKPLIFEKYEIGTLIKDTTQIGLGLTFCKLAIEAHGGSIAVENNQPQGSIFTLTIPNQPNLA
ncbi:response regulator [Tumidithrix elongata RA019]|uniref:histidine kinase n=1 Tax=Tumidithrix elongata BACA0141 TaxID=2716417 RepID=A0AAW9Q728_9CYAN|nr:response regulator [Tumidithrix elongata RA019]